VGFLASLMSMVRTSSIHLQPLHMGHASNVAWFSQRLAVVHACFPVPHTLVLALACIGCSSAFAQSAEGERKKVVVSGSRNEHDHDTWL
jgi:hypothetical protein